MAEDGYVDDYLAAIADDDVRAALEDLRRTVAETAPEATEGKSYDMPAFKYEGRALVGFAAFKNHCSFFPMSVGVIDQHADDLGPHRTSKGTVQFTPDDPLPRSVVASIVRARVREIDERNRSKR